LDLQPQRVSGVLCKWKLIALGAFVSQLGFAAAAINAIAFRVFNFADCTICKNKRAGIFVQTRALLNTFFLQI